MVAIPVLVVNEHRSLIHEPRQSSVASCSGFHRFRRALGGALITDAPAKRTCRQPISAELFASLDEFLERRFVGDQQKISACRQSLELVELIAGSLVQVRDGQKDRTARRVIRSVSAALCS